MSPLRSRLASPTNALVLSSLLFAAGTAGADRLGPVSGAPSRAPGLVVPAPTAPDREAPHFARAPEESDVAEVPLDRDAIRARLIQNRAANIKRFEAYVKAGVYPSNTMTSDKRNVWRDADGHYCAAATIIRQSGQVALAGRVAEQNNFLRLADVEQGPLMDWMLTSGLTQEEIAAIQEPFEPVARRPQRRVEPDLRVAEDARLRKRYAEVDALLAKGEQKALDLATDRLAAHRALAWQMLSSRSTRRPGA
jgi:hypothetical protein